MQYKYIYDEQKNLKLKKERGISFEDIIIAIKDGKILDIIPHHNKKKYPNQMIMVIDIDKYVYLVPYIEVQDSLILKTLFKSRKFTKLYLGGNRNEAS
ncbi:MAG TPA: BrnT family toxin [Verrucomicrobiae bacterium]|nr:BrnT family toxin [Verrucomicrobiae bacterium]